jgi:hypothetical protein
MAAGLSVLKIHGVTSIEVRVLRNHDCLSVPQRPSIGGICREPKRVGMLTQAIDVWVFGEICSQSNILRLEDQLFGACIKQDLFRVAPRDRERERFFFEVENEVGLFNLPAAF